MLQATTINANDQARHGADDGDRLELEPLAVCAREAARLLDVSPRTFRRLDLAGQAPAPVHIGKPN